MHVAPALVDYVLALEEIAKVSASYGVSVAVTGLPQVIISSYGSEEQKTKWLPGLADGSMLGAFALSEPGSGSDAGSLKTAARLDGETALDAAFALYLGDAPVGANGPCYATRVLEVGAFQPGPVLAMDEQLRTLVRSAVSRYSTRRATSIPRRPGWSRR